MGSMRQQLPGETDKPDHAAMPVGHLAGPLGTDPRIVSIITQTVEQAVIPRMLLARRDDAHPSTVQAPATDGVTLAQVAELVRLVTARDEAASIAFVQALYDGGVPAETLYLDLLAPTARALGQMWVDDDCDFTDVTVGLFLLQNALRELGAAFQSEAPTDAMALRALLVPLPGEQHTFGLSMVFDFFRRAGWNAWSGPLASEAELAEMLGNSWFDVVGFSLACDEQLEDAARAIRIARKASRNPDVVVMVGGPGLAANPTLAALVGADGTAVDGRQAVLQAKALVGLAGSRRCS